MARRTSPGTPAVRTVRLVEKHKNDFTGLTWLTYKDRAGNRVNVCVQSYIDRRPKSRAQCRAEAVQLLRKRYWRR